LAQRSAASCGAERSKSSEAHRRYPATRVAERSREPLLLASPDHLRKIDGKEILATGCRRPLPAREGVDFLDGRRLQAAHEEDREGVLAEAAASYRSQCHGRRHPRRSN